MNAELQAESSRVARWLGRPFVPVARVGGMYANYRMWRVIIN